MFKKLSLQQCLSLSVVAVLTLYLSPSLVLGESVQSKEKDQFFADIFLAGSVDGAPYSEQSFKEKGKSLITFYDSYKADTLKIGDKLLLIDVKSHNTFDAVFERMNKKDPEDPEPTISMSGVASVDNYDSFIKVKDSVKLAIRNFKKSEIDFCKTEEIKIQDKQLMGFLEANANKLALKKNLEKLPIYLISCDSQQIFYFPYYYDVSKEAYSRKTETLFFVKKDGSNKLIFKKEGNIKLLLGMKPKKIKEWQYFYTFYNEYAGGSYWGNLTSTDFEKYITFNEWAE